ncbi:MAG: stalk domain-containing protein [Peptostreptococcaceae bacterium]|nr:stalk domain-containing protein [Peptostreptococcaceae bacterium]
MKRYSKIMAVAFASLTIATGMGIASNNAVSGVSKVNYKFVINEKAVELPQNYLVMSKNGTTYVPLRFISETLGADVDYKQGTITIGTKPTTTMSQPEDSKKIKELEAEVEKLKKENKELNTKLTAINNTMNYKTLPTAQDSTNDLNIKLLSIYNEGNGAKFYVEFKNKSKDRFFVVDPFKTKVYVDGKEYTASSQHTDAVLNSSVNVGGEVRYGGIVFDKLSDIKVKGSVVFYLRDNGEKDDTVTIYFDNTK